MTAPSPTHEAARLKALRELCILDTLPEGEFDEITTLAAEICETPIAFITLVDENRVWAKSRVGVETQEIPREATFCAAAICGKTLFVVQDTEQDERFSGKRMMGVDPRVRFYAGAPLLTPEGEALGTLCVVDLEPRVLTEMQTRSLEVLGRQVMRQMRSRQQVLVLQQKEARLRAMFEQQNEAELSRRASEERFREMADNIREIFYNYDVLNGKLLYANRAYETLWGLPMATVYDNPMAYLEAVRLEDKRIAEQALEDQLAGKETNAEFRIIRPDGEERWVHEHAVPVRDAQGRVERIVGTMKDITERKRAYEKILESEERFRLLSRATDEVIWDWNQETGIHWWNDRFESVFGHHRSALAPSVEAWQQLIHPDDREVTVESIKHAFESGKQVWTSEYRFLRGDGTYANVYDRGYVKRNAEGKVVRMIGGMKDLTQSKRAEVKLREQATLLDKAQDAIMLRDLDHKVLYWNQSAERLYGWKAEEVMGSSVHERIYVDTRVYDDIVAMTLEEGEWTGELRQVNRDGQPLTVESRWTLVRDEDGNPKSMLTINTDITDKKKLEQQFLRAQRMESIGTLAGGIAHDLNNVLAPIMMSIELLKMDEPEGMRLSILETIETSAERGAEMVKQVLSFARGMTSQHKEVEICLVISEVKQMMLETFPPEIEIRSDIAEDLWRVEGDPTQLHQVLLNLCVNARDAMEDGGTLRLLAKNVVLDEAYAALNLEATPGRHVRIQVEDTGAGMPAEVMERIFEPFYTTKEQGKGTGLGLSTTQAIVKSHGGFLRVHSEEGKGSRFRVYLPAMDEGLRHGEEEAELEATGLPRGQGELILVVDDELAVRRITQHTLEAFGYRVLLAEHGAEAVAIFATQQGEVALVLTDMMMPEMDGPAVIRVIKKMQPDVKIIAASGLNASSMMAKATQEGVLSFIPKPYTAEKLLRVVNSVLRSEQ